MNETSEISQEQHQYLLHAVWCVPDDHGGSNYGHRVIHSTWDGEWNTKAIVHQFVEGEHPE